MNYGLISRAASANGRIVTPIEGKYNIIPKHSSRDVSNLTFHLIVQHETLASLYSKRSHYGLSFVFVIVCILRRRLALTFDNAGILSLWLFLANAE